MLEKVRPTYMRQGIADSIRRMGEGKGVAFIVDDTSEASHVVQIRPRLSWHGGDEPSALGLTPAVRGTDNSIPTRTFWMGKLAKENQMYQTGPFDRCPVCGGGLEEKEVEKLLKGGVHTAVINVKADVCLYCGERLYSQETVKHFEEIRKKLERRDVTGFKQIGQSYQVKV